MISKILAKEVLNEALKTGADYAEIFYEDSTHNGIQLENGLVKGSTSNSVNGVSIRLLKENQTVIGYTNNLTKKGLLELAKNLSSSFHGKQIVTVDNFEMIKVKNRNPIKRSYDDVSKEEIVLAGLLSGKFDNLSWGEKKQVDFFTVKGLLENLEHHLGISFKYQKMDNVENTMHPGRSAVIKFQNEVIGYLAALHPAYAKTLDLEDTYIFEIVLTKVLKQKASIIKFSPMVKKPVVVRDFAFVMEKDIPVGDVVEAIYRIDRNLISNVEVFDIYESALLGSKRSVAFKVSLSSDDNLTDEVITEKTKKITDMMEQKFKALLRM